jgi:hypothetical protein
MTDIVPNFEGIWTTGEASVRFNPDGTYETLHVPGRGTYEVMRDSDWELRRLTSRTGYLLLMKFETMGGSLQLIDQYSPTEATLLKPRSDGAFDELKIRLAG